MSDFSKFSVAVSRRFDELSKNELFVADIARGRMKEPNVPLGNGDALWEAYLAAFPEGTNPIFRERTEHDCSCCKNFIRNIGTAVAIVNGKLTTVWDLKGLEAPYDTVAAKLHELVSASEINGLFRLSEQKYGAVFTIEALEGGDTRRWNHFHGTVTRHFSRTVDKDRGEYNTIVGVFKRGLEELNQADIDTVVDLIQSKAIYRGEEHTASIKAFQKLKTSYGKLKTQAEKNIFVWENASNPAARFRNTVIGTLIQDLSAGVDLESAVRSFESKVAPMNYKRPTALITPAMIKQAVKTISELGLEDALKRRFAKLSDVSVNDVLWVDRSVKSKMKEGGIEDILMATVAPGVSNKDYPEPIGIDEFMEKIVPKTTAMEIFMKNTMTPNLMSLTGPVHADSGKLFKWGNDFAWTYAGNIADSNIKERVKRAGGNVTTAQLRISLAWYNFDDLDLHVTEPSGRHIYFGSKMGTNGSLDVDMNAGYGRTREPVENVAYTKVADGVYQVKVNQFNMRETSNVGFQMEIEVDGVIQNFTYAPRVNGDVHVMDITMKGGRIEKLELRNKNVEGGMASKDIWGIKTETFVKVNTLMMSPNYWGDNAVGNKHWFFIMDKCINDEPTRGFMNEFLNGALDKHRKVFEILGDKTKCPPSDEQLSGLGFSSTRGDVVLVQCTGPKSRKLFEINF